MAGIKSSLNNTKINSIILKTNNTFNHIEVQNTELWKPYLTYKKSLLIDLWDNKSKKDLINIVLKKDKYKLIKFPDPSFKNVSHIEPSFIYNYFGNINFNSNYKILLSKIVENVPYRSFGISPGRITYFQPPLT
jgi:hypothetical protein